MSKEIKRIAVFTSGGDAPGMNAAIRAVVRTATYHKLEVYKINRGYDGMVSGDIHRMTTADVGNILHRGGTIIKTARSKEFMTKEGRQKARQHLKNLNINACVAIGGNGTLTGAQVFTSEYPDVSFVGLPGTIDNDLFGTDLTIGFDTAVNTAIEAVDKIRDTADSHNRLFFVEVMGRDSGFIALNTGIGGGASNVIIPEAESSIDNIVEMINKAKLRNKLFSVIIVAEGSKLGSAFEIAAQVDTHFGEKNTRVAVIGHLQRGGSPSAVDRILASRLGYASVIALMEGKKQVMIGVANNKISYTSFEDAIGKHKVLNDDLLKMAKILAH